jgi:FtsH-binding integral membrane protein
MGIVIALMIAQLAVTYYTMEALAKNDSLQEYIKNNVWLLVIAFVLPLVIILVLAFVPMSMSLKLILFTLFSALFGFLLSVSRRYMTPELVKAAMVATLGIFVSMFLVGIVLAGLGYDLFWLGVILFVLLLILVIVGIVMLFIHPDKKAMRTRAILVIILFAVYIIFDTNQIIMRDYNGDYVMAGLDYYLDMLNIFTALLQVLGDSS